MQILRFTWHQLRGEPLMVIATIARTLGTDSLAH
jgi:hypothetical protein